MKVEKLAEMTEDELRREQSSLEEQIFRIRFQIGTGNIENPSKLGVTRRNLARVKTIIRERELKMQVEHKGRRRGRKSKPKDAGKSSEARS